MPRPIYVEVTIERPVDSIWEKSQDPELHRRWDLRFSEIDYLPRAEGEPQRFRYASRLGGWVVGGTGESIGEFQAEFFPVEQDRIPPFVKPLREERRE